MERKRERESSQEKESRKKANIYASAVREEMQYSSTEQTAHFILSGI